MEINIDRTHIAFVLDESISMQPIKEKTQEAYNAFIMEQKTIPGKATFTLAGFSSPVKYHIDTPVKMKRVQVLENFNPDGGATALLDAIYTTIANTVMYLGLLPEKKRPGKILVAILTDGQENASQQTTKAKLAELIESKIAEGWSFVYLGANQDAISEAKSMGIPTGNALTFIADSVHMGVTLDSMSAYTTSYRKASSRAAGQSLTFTDEDREKQKK